MLMCFRRTPLCSLSFEVRIALQIENILISPYWNLAQHYSGAITDGTGTVISTARSNIFALFNK